MLKDIVTRCGENIIHLTVKLVVCDSCEIDDDYCCCKMGRSKRKIYLELYLVNLSITLFNLVSETDGTSFCTSSLTNKSVSPGLDRSANSNAVFNSSITSGF